MIEPTPITWDADDRLAGDLRCVSRGHNLRGLRRAGACGECGTPVAWALEGNYLYSHDPIWVDRLRRGVACLTLTLPWLWMPPAWIAFGIGLWHTTTPDPDADRGGFPRFTLPRVLFAAAPVLIACVAVPACGVYWSSSTFLPRFNPTLATTLLVAGTLLLIPLFAGAAMSRIVRWADSKRLKRRHNSSLWLSGLGLAFVAGWGANELAILDLDALVGLGVIGLLFGTWGIGLCVFVLCEAWRFLDRAEVHARARKTKNRLWQRPMPGAGDTNS